MTLTTLIITNAVLAALLIYTLAHLLMHAVHSDRHHGARQLAELLALPAHERGRIAA